MNATAKISSKSQTVVPRQVRELLGVGPGDTLIYRLTDAGVILEKAADPVEDEDWGDPFACFTEWASPEDDEAFKDL